MDDAQPRPSDDHPLPSDAPTRQFPPVSDASAWTPPAAWGPPTAPVPVAPAPSSAAPSWGEPIGATAPARPRRLTRGALVAVPALLLGAGVATVVTLAAVDHRTPSTTTAASSSATTAGTGTHHASGTKTAAAAHRTTGTLTAASGTTWTVQTSRGPVTVDLGTRTAYGTAAQPLQASDFHTGEKVVVSGTRSGDTVDATRVHAVAS